MPSSGELRDQLLERAEFWRTLVTADEMASTTLAAARTFQVITTMDLCQKYAGGLMIAVSRFVTTGDRTEIDTLLAEIVDHA